MGKTSDGSGIRGRGIQRNSLRDEDNAPVSRIDTIRQAAQRVMERSFTPDEEELDLNSWRLDGE